MTLNKWSHKCTQNAHCTGEHWGHWLGCSRSGHGIGIGFGSGIGLGVGMRSFVWAILECYHCSAGIFCMTTSRADADREFLVQNTECGVKCLQNKCGTWIRQHLLPPQSSADAFLFSSFRAEATNLIKLNLFNQIRRNQHCRCEGGAGEDRMLTRCVGVACGPKVGNGIWCRYTHFLFWHWHCHSVGTFVRLSLTLEVQSLAWSLTF